MQYNTQLNMMVIPHSISEQADHERALIDYQYWRKKKVDNIPELTLPGFELSTEVTLFKVVPRVTCQL